MFHFIMLPLLKATKEISQQAHTQNKRFFWHLKQVKVNSFVSEIFQFLFLFEQILFPCSDFIIIYFEKYAASDTLG